MVVSDGNKLDTSVHLLSTDYGSATPHPLVTTTCSYDADTTVRDIKHLMQPELDELLRSQTASRAFIMDAQVRDWFTGFESSKPGHYEMLWSVDILGDDGQILYNRPVDHTTLVKLHEAIEAGLLPSELSPEVIAFWPPEGLGDGSFLPQALEAWSQFGPILKDILSSAADSVVVIEGLRRLYVHLTAQEESYKKRGAEPKDVLRQVLGHKYWRVDEFSLRFGLGKTDSEELLDALGYEPSREHFGFYQLASRVEEEAAEKSETDARAHSASVSMIDMERPLEDHFLITALKRLEEKHDPTA